jgi:hypothetical protein
LILYHYEFNSDKGHIPGLALDNPPNSGGFPQFMMANFESLPDRNQCVRQKQTGAAVADIERIGRSFESFTH